MKIQPTPCCPQNRTPRQAKPNFGKLKIDNATLSDAMKVFLEMDKYPHIKTVGSVTGKDSADFMNIEIATQKNSVFESDLFQKFKDMLLNPQKSQEEFEAELERKKNGIILPKKPNNVSISMF